MSAAAPSPQYAQYHIVLTVPTVPQEYPRHRVPPSTPSAAEYPVVEPVPTHIYARTVRARVLKVVRWAASGMASSLERQQYMSRARPSTFGLTRLGPSCRSCVRMSGVWRDVDYAL